MTAIRSLTFACLAFTTTAGLSAKRPNLLFIMADDLGWADTTLYGHTKFYQTPNIDRLAKRGMTFSRAYSASPLCSPTRASVLTGQNPARIGLTAPNCHVGAPTLVTVEGTKAAPGLKAIQPVPLNRFDTKYETLAERFREEGFATGHFGKWHLGAKPYSPREHGFDVDIPNWHGPGPAGNFVAPWRYPDFDPKVPGEHIEDRMAEEAVAYMEANRDQPFFLNYWMFSVHAPFNAKQKLIDAYRDQVDPQDAQRSPTYAAMIESMDDAVGTLLDGLDKYGLTDNTIIVFFSDNGGNMYNEVDNTTPTSNRPLRGGKATMFEGGVRVPLIVSWPGHIEPETRSDVLVQSTDFFPTLLDLYGWEKKEGQIFDGVSVAKALQGEPLERGPIFTYFPHDPPVPDWIPPSISIHEGHWKLIREFFQGEDGQHRYRLFNLRDDIGEANNLAASEPERVQAMDQKISSFIEEANVVLPIRNPDFDPSKYQPEKEGVPKNRQKKVIVAKKKDAPLDPRLKGWRLRGTTCSFTDGHAVLKPSVKKAFLGIGLEKMEGPCEVTFRIHSDRAFKESVSWGHNRPSPQSTSFEVTANSWQEVTVSLNGKPNLGILRLNLPGQGSKVKIDYIKVNAAKEHLSSDF